MKNNILFSLFFLVTFSSVSQASIFGFPVPVEHSATGTLDIIDPSGTHIGAVPVDFAPLANDFGFTYLGNYGFGFNTQIYSVPGTYNFMSTPDSVFPTSVPLSMAVNAGQIGMRTFIEWNANIYDILTVWDVTQSGNVWNLYATDMDGDGIRGYQMVSGPFAGLNFVMDATIVTPIPAAVWLFGSGVGLLLCVARKQRKMIV